MESVASILKKHVGIGLLLTGFFVFNANAALTGSPAMFDFGKLPQTDIGAECFFSLHNTGDKSVEIVSIDPSCDCLIADLQLRKVQSGKSIAFPVFFTFENERGRQDRELLIGYRERGDKKMRFLTLFIQGTITSPIMCEPERIDFGLVALGTCQTGRIEVVTQDAPFSLKPGQQQGQLEATFITDKPALRHEIGIILPADKPGPFSSDIPILTDHPDMPIVFIPCIGTISLPFSVHPKSLSFTRGTALNARITLRSVFNEPFEIRSVESTDPALQLFVHKTENTVEITVQIKPEQTNFANALIRIATDHPMSPIIEIPVRSLNTAHEKGTKP